MASWVIFILLHLTNAQQLQRQSTVNALTTTSNSVTISHDAASATISDSSYNISVASQNAYDLLLSMQPKWGFKDTVTTTLDVTIYGETPNPESDTDFLTIFSVGNTQFFSFFIHLDTDVIATKVYPLTTLCTKPSLSSWMADELIHDDRWDRMSNGGDNWKSTDPRFKQQGLWPLRFEIINDPILDTCQFKFYNQGVDYVAGNVFNVSFNALQPVDVYIMGDTTGEQFVVHRIDVAQYHVNGVPTVPPTPSPITVPTNAPTTSNPTQIPTTIPSLSPTVIPSLSPTSIPSTSPTDIPSSNPSQIPSLIPTQSPTGVPTSNPTLNPSLYPTIHPTASSTSTPNPSTKSPSNDPTTTPTITHSHGPSLYPTFMPSVTPSSHPSIPPSSPSNTPTASPIIKSIIFEPTTEIPSTFPTMDPSQSYHETTQTIADVATSDLMKVVQTPRPVLKFETMSYILIIVIIISCCFISVLILLVCVKRKQSLTKAGAANRDKAADAIAMDRRADNSGKLRRYHAVAVPQNSGHVSAPMDEAAPIKTFKAEDSQSTKTSETYKTSSDDVIMDEVADEIRYLKLKREHGTFGKDSHEESEGSYSMHNDEETEDDDETSGPVVRFLEAVQDGINYEETETKREEMTEYEETEDDDGFKDRTMPMPFKKNTSGMSYDMAQITPAFMAGHVPNQSHTDIELAMPRGGHNGGFIVQPPPPTNTTLTTVTHSGTAVSHDIESSSDDSYHNRFGAYNFVENQQILNQHDMAIKNVNKDINIGPMMMMLDIMKSTGSPRSPTDKEQLSLRVD
eukprot:395197_1